MVDIFHLTCQLPPLLDYLECYAEKVWLKKKKKNLLVLLQCLFFPSLIVVEFIGYVFTQDKDYIFEPLFS